MEEQKNFENFVHTRVILYADKENGGSLSYTLKENTKNGKPFTSINAYTVSKYKDEKGELKSAFVKLLTSDEKLIDMLKNDKIKANSRMVVSGFKQENGDISITLKGFNYLTSVDKINELKKSAKNKEEIKYPNISVYGKFVPKSKYSDLDKGQMSFLVMDSTFDKNTESQKTITTFIDLKFNEKRSGELKRLADKMGGLENVNMIVNANIDKDGRFNVVRSDFEESAKSLYEDRQKKIAKWKAEQNEQNKDNGEEYPF